MRESRGLVIGLFIRERDPKVEIGVGGRGLIDGGFEQVDARGVAGGLLVRMGVTGKKSCCDEGEGMELFHTNGVTER